MGQGDPIIVIHGGAGYITQESLLPAMARLADHNCVIFYDQRGLGRSTGEVVPEQINLKTYVSDIEAIRRSLGLKRVSLLGHSWGALLAMHYAINYPESIDKLILLSAMPGSSEDLGLFFTELTKRLAPYHERLQEIESSDLYLTGDPKTVENQQKMTFQTYLYKPENVCKLNLYRPRKEIMNGFKVVEIFGETVFSKPYNLFTDLGNLKCPTLILHGAEDPIPFSTAENLQKAIPHSKLIKIEQCGHFPYVEQPDVFFQATFKFLEAH